MLQVPDHALGHPLGHPLGHTFDNTSAQTLTETDSEGDGQSKNTKCLSVSEKTDIPSASGYSPSVLSESTAVDGGSMPRDSFTVRSSTP